MKTMFRTVAATMIVAAGAFAQAPINDEPAGAVVLNSGTNSGVGFSTRFATQSTGMPVPGCGSPSVDVWFLFTPATTGAHILHTSPVAGAIPGSLRDSVISVYDAGLTTVLGCNDDSVALAAPDASGFLSLVNLNLTSGTPVFVRVSRYGTNPDGTFNVNVIDSTVNGGSNGGTDCATALPVTDGVWYGTLFGDVASGSVVGGCANFTATTLDVWYTYTAPTTGTANLFLEGVTATAFRMAVYDLTLGCGAETVVAGTCVTTRNTQWAATAGTTYAIRVGVTTAPATDLAGIFGFSIATIVPTANNDCLTAATLLDGDNYLTTVGATADAATTVTCPSGTFAVATTLDVWGVYTTVAPGKVTFGARGVGTQNFVVYTGVCGALTPLACVAGTAVFTATDLVGGTTYWVRGGTTAAANVSAINFDVFYVPFPANDECVGALPLVTGNNTGLNNFGASTSAGVASCQAHQNDVWFSWTAPLSATVLISGCGSSSDPVFTLYSACGGSEVACDDDDLNNLGPCATTQTLNPFIRTPVVAGNTYLLRAGNNTAADMTFNVNISYEFSLTLTYDNTLFNFTVADVAGNPGDLALNAITLNQGLYPNGYFYGVDIPIFEVFNLILTGPPFFVLLDGAGGYTQTLPGVPPLGITLYGVGVDFSPAGIFVKKSAPVSVTLL